MHMINALVLCVFAT